MRPERVKVFGYPVDITTKKQAVNHILNLIRDKKGLHIVTLNPEIIAAADKTTELAAIIRNAGLVLPESTGIMLAVKSMGLFNAEKIPGIEFSEELLGKSAEKGFKIAFLGGKPEVITSLNTEIKKKFPEINIVFSHHGYFEQADKMIGQICDAAPDLLLVGLGCPKQEFFINECQKQLKTTVMIGVGGSFDVWAKKIKRAPVFFRTFGLEWFCRLITQPERFNRMFPVLPLFFLRVIFDRKGLEK